MRRAKYEVGQKVYYARYNKCLEGEIVGVKKGLFAVKYTMKIPKICGFEYRIVYQSQIMSTKEI